jgi:hypothetical protein
MNRVLIVSALAAALGAVRPVAAQVPADSYADAAARTLVERARARRGLVDRSISSYRTLSTERISVGYRLLRRDRLLFRRETAARVHWQRDSVIDIEVLGAREVVPVAEGKVRLPEDLADYMPHIAFNPLDSEFLFRMDTTSIRHPLAAGSERDYRFAAGDSSVIRLPDGRQVRLRELLIEPRRRDSNLIAGSFWVDLDSHAVVRAGFRLARPWNMADEDEDVPGFLRSVRADLSHFAVEYGLWDLRWWLPRLMLVEGVVEFGRFGTMPMAYERSYADYEVTADTTVRPVPRDTVGAGCRGRFSLSVNVGGSDSARAARTRERLERRDRPGEAQPECARRYRVTVPDSLETLLVSEHLPGSIWDERELVSERELEELGRLVANLPAAPWQIARPRLDWGLGGAGTARFNRIEGLGLGARGSVDLAVRSSWPRVSTALPTSSRKASSSWLPRPRASCTSPATARSAPPMPRSGRSASCTRSMPCSSAATTRSTSAPSAPRSPWRRRARPRSGMRCGCMRNNSGPCTRTQTGAYRTCSTAIASSVPTCWRTRRRSTVLTAAAARSERPRTRALRFGARSWMCEPRPGPSSSCVRPHAPHVAAAGGSGGAGVRGCGGHYGRNVAGAEPLVPGWHLHAARLSQRGAQRSGLLARAGRGGHSASRLPAGVLCGRGLGGCSHQ